MRYHSVEPAVFLERPNRFIARVICGGREETAHVKNTGRCRELLIPGARVYVQRHRNPARKTALSLIAVEKDGGLSTSTARRQMPFGRKRLPAACFSREGRKRPR